MNLAPTTRRGICGGGRATTRRGCRRVLTRCRTGTGIWGHHRGCRTPGRARIESHQNRRHGAGPEKCQLRKSPDTGEAAITQLCGAGWTFHTPTVFHRFVMEGGENCKKFVKKYW
jgi:hypothetical protein